MNAVYFFVFLFGSIALYYGLGYLLRRILRQKWSRFAAKHRLDFSAGRFAGTPKVTGEYRNVQVQLQIVIKKDRHDRKTTYTHFDTWMKTTAQLDGLKIYKQGMLAKIGKAVGTQDIAIGDPDFDDKVMIKCNAPTSALRVYLQPGLKRAILQLIDKHPGVYFDEYGCHYVRNGYVVDAHKLDSMLEKMVECCVQGDRKNQAYKGRD